MIDNPTKVKDLIKNLIEYERVIEVLEQSGAMAVNWERHRAKNDFGFDLSRQVALDAPRSLCANALNLGE